jgi:beta-N-acetylhexosaminidase
MVVGLPPGGLDRAFEKDFAAYTPAGVLLFRRDFRDLDDLRALTRRLRKLARPRRLFIATDEEGGFVSQLGGFLEVPPSAMLLGRGAEPGDAERTAQVTARRLRAVGVDWVFAPVADVHSNPQNPVIGPRAFGADPATVARCVAEQVRGFQAGRVACTLKHFPGHGDTALDSHTALPRCDADRPRLAERELVPFGAALGADAVMTAHVVYPALDPDHPATFSRAIARDLLRRQLRFQGVCITDAMEMKGAALGEAPFEAARAALEAGCDLLLYAEFGEVVRQVRYRLSRALVDGTLARASVDAARPRLAALDRRVPQPREEELAAPLESLTPPDWSARLTAIAERGLRWSGGLPAAAADRPWRVAEPAWPYGEPLAALLRREGVTLAEGEREAEVDVVALANRAPLPASEVERLRALCTVRPTALVAFQSDAFLDALPEAALRVSAADTTPLARAVVARGLARRARAGR